MNYEAPNNPHYFSLPVSPRIPLEVHCWHPQEVQYTLWWQLVSLWPSSLPLPTQLLLQTQNTVGGRVLEFSLRASPHFPSHRLRSVQVIYIFNFNIKILPEDVTYLRWDVFNILQWFLALVDPLSRAWVVWKDGDYDYPGCQRLF